MPSVPKPATFPQAYSTSIFETSCNFSCRWRRSICVWPKSSMRNARQNAVACFWRWFDHNFRQKKNHLSCYLNRRVGLALPGVWLDFLPSLLWAVLPSFPTIAAKSACTSPSRTNCVVPGLTQHHPIFFHQREPPIVHQGGLAKPQSGPNSGVPSHRWRSE